MNVSLITKDDLQEFKNELIEELKELLALKNKERKLWLKSSEVKELLNISSGTLQNLRANGTLLSSKIGGIYYYSSNDIEKLLTRK
ncbi:helix-turn-helix domain-containing protein [Cloacibacterium normanense]|uniref:helix-turn-helix domain-containing protein n=1 Tax=Cloacibacterium normanense TaxID=237258 RepID=UPI003919CD7C